jgi:hypothetical protein
VTHYVELVRQAKAIQQRLDSQTAGPAVRQALLDLTDLAVRALSETNDAFEGLAALVMALHAGINRRRQAPSRRS